MNDVFLAGSNRFISYPANENELTCSKMYDCRRALAPKVSNIGYSGKTGMTSLLSALLKSQCQGGIMLKIKRSAAQQVADNIQERIQQGVYPIGGALPGQRLLAEEMGVGRPAIREAISALEGLGMLTVEPGRGVFVADPASNAGGWRFASRYSLEDVYAVRATLESLSVQLAAQHASLAQINSLDTFVDDLEAAVNRGDLPAMATADRSFHRHLAELSGNPLLREMLDTFDTVITESKSIAFLDDSGKNHREVVAEHKAIVAALKAKDGEAASRSIKSHITNAENRAHRVHTKGGTDV
jgi:GntR family transcriptional repressor for pyruvate dehydrogenase complex